VAVEGDVSQERLGDGGDHKPQSTTTIIGQAALDDEAGFHGTPSTLDTHEYQLSTEAVRRHGEFSPTEGSAVDDEIWARVYTTLHYTTLHHTTALQARSHESGPFDSSFVERANQVGVAANRIGISK
jgi:hypothetical protein